MDFLKSFKPLGLWLIRLSLILMIYFLYRHEVASLNFNALHFYLAAFSFLGALLLMIGGFSGNSKITQWGGLLLVILSLYGIFTSFSQVDFSFSVKLSRLAIATYFMAAGNQE